MDVSIPMGIERQRTFTELMGIANSRGLRTNLKDYLECGGLVCYAAKPNSLVIRSDGVINKCTVALDADYNDVGRLRADGSIDLDVEKLSRWTNSGIDEDKTCQGCALSASCQGNACPLERIENNRRPCPPPKNFMEAIVQMVEPPTKRTGDAQWQKTALKEESRSTLR